MVRSWRLLSVQLLITAAVAQGQVVGAPDAPTKGVGNYFSDRRFVTDALELGMAEMALSRLATTNSTNKELKDFADAVLKQEGAAQTELRDLASQKQLKTPSKPDDAQSATLQQLESQKGTQFDHSYVEQSRKDLAKLIEIHQSETRSSDAALAAFANKRVSDLRGLERKAQTGFDAAR